LKISKTKVPSALNVDFS